MTWLTVQEQDRRIREVFPEFKLTLNAGWMAVWEGPLTPIMRRYRVRVVHFRRRFFDTWSLENDYAAVQVVDPVIGLDPRGTRQLPPHIYFNMANPPCPRLCLYDPKERLWAPEEYIADTIIPWTIDWLFFSRAGLIRGRGKAGDDTRREGQAHAPERTPRTRRAAIGWIAPSPPGSTGLAKGSAFSHPFH